MATCQTAEWADASPIVKLTVTQSASTDTTATLSYTLQYIADYAADTNGVGREYTIKIAGSTVKSGTYNIDGVTGTKTIASGTKTINKTTAKQTISFSTSFDFRVTWSGVYGGTKSASGSISVAAKTSYKIAYNANGGSGAPSAQTKWHGTALTLSSTNPTRTGYTFQGWATSASGSVAYAAGASYTANAAATLYAVWEAITYTVTYNANGGSGAPSAQTKTYGVALTLSSTKPTRTNYTFKGWGTSASATTVSYAAGASYTNNAAITLYAIWTLSYVKPRITSFKIQRCTSDGTASETGTYAKVTFNWATDNTVSAVAIQYKTQSATSWTSVTVTASGTSGSVSQIVGGGALSTETSYVFRVYVTDSGGTTYSTELTMSTVKFPIDVKKGGTGVAICKVAETANLFDVGCNSIFRGDVTVDGDIQAHAKIVSQCGSDTADTNGWYKVASCTMSSYGNTNILYYIKSGYGANCHGLLELDMRSSNVSISCLGCKWLVRSGFNTNHVRVVISDMTWTLYVYKANAQYGRVYFSEIQHRNINGAKDSYSIIYYNSSTPETEEPVASYTTKDEVWIPTVLYNNTSGTAGTVTLNETAANFSYLEIFTKKSDYGDTGMSRIYSPNGKTAYLTSSLFTGDYVYVYTKSITISGTSITINNSKIQRSNADGTTLLDDSSNYITRILGYR